MLDEDRRIFLLSARRARWAARAAESAVELTEAQRVYAARRARALGTELEPRVADCGRVSVRARCQCPGTRWVPRTCRQHAVCELCCQRRARKYGRRIREGLEAAIRERCQQLGTRGAKRWRTVLITLSVRHTGDIETDHAALRSGWRKLYKAMHKRGWGWFPYVGTVEVTPGRDGQGHVHAHVVAVWPWRDWADVARMWRRACPESTRINIMQAHNTRGAAKYVAKYVSKGVYVGEFTPRLRANVVAGMYQARWVFTSVRFWQPFVPCCQQCCAPVQLLVVQVERAYNGGRVPDDRPEWLVDTTDWWFARRKPGDAPVGGGASAGDVPTADQRASAGGA